MALGKAKVIYIAAGMVVQNLEGSNTGKMSGMLTALSRSLVRQIVMIGRSHFLKLFFSHGFIHFPGRPFKFGNPGFTAFGRKGGTCCLLLGLGLSFHGLSPSVFKG
jgi:hypothetical protein